MVAIDSAHDMPAAPRFETGHTAHIVLFAFLGSALLAAASLVVFAADGNGWAMAAQMVSRFSLLLFVAAMSAEPVARLVPPLRALGRERASLTLAFAASSFVALLCVVAPSQLGGEAMSAPAVAYCVLTGLILVVMLFSAHPATLRRLGAPAWRALQRIATSYYWLVFVITGLSHLVGPHRPDAWYGFSLLLLTATLLLRFADSFLAHWRVQAMAEKVG